MVRRIAGGERVCAQCKGVISAGSVYATYRERAICYAEATASGTMYPQRKLCLACAEKREAPVAPVSDE